MKIRMMVYGLLILGLVALIVYRVSENKEATAFVGGKEKGPLPISGMIVKPEKFENRLSLSGSLEANELVDIRSEVSGVVREIYFREGSRVSEGQVLFKVDDIELTAQLSKAETAKKLAAENERRAKLLLEKQGISQEEYDMASADYESASAEAELISAQRYKTSVRAPFSGTIGLRNISKGTYVTPSTTVARLVNTDQLKLTFSIPEKYVSRMKVNSEFTFTTTDTGRSFTARVYAIEPEVDVTTRTLKMRAVADNSEGQLYPGMFVNVKFPLEVVPDALMVPSEALIPIQNGKEVFVVRKGKAQAVQVETGARTSSDVRVLSGLQPGDTILTYGIMALENGAAVDVVLDH
ncbi:efflux RND transporter periplasmic adaptor subunit [Sinomicrobium soli]|uniref:efflux RND transporter periplasmic adaptor subunit n=1 Tax=Sinomicrobium sp. N-1-3-6 TaxID=2219864 RepID=UPI000DCBE4A5|nr:efflux RND transporter periplasmic adaptor subunit [Sinomicrobium sp. N-1-3-6]RAV30949.1 efflux transporter periplasmic adaptor subunit [Sinomicrobium sp. N-1-3-6]